MDKGLVSFVQKMRVQYERLLSSDPTRYNVPKIAAATSMDAFDDALIAPMFDFKNSSHYYREASAANTLTQIAIPYLFIHAANDPIVPGDLVFRHTDFSTEATPHSPSLLCHARTSAGAHSMDFPTGLLPFISCESSWGARASEDFFAIARLYSNCTKR